MARHVVTGAFGFSGRHIAGLLLDRGHDVTTLTNHADRPDPFGGRVAVRPLDFTDPAGLTESLRGADTLFNTYWMRLERGGVTYADAVANSRVLFAAAREAGVRRIVHMSIANAERGSDLPYYRGKLEVESALRDSGVSHAILRPAVLVGDQPMLVNSIAWMLRHLPAFGIPGNGRYGFQPVHIDDHAGLAVEMGQGDENLTVDSAGPEQFTFADFVGELKRTIGSRSIVMRVPPPMALLVGGALGLLVRDTVLTRDELNGLIANLLTSHQPPLGTTRVSDWLADAGSWLGRRWLPEARGRDA
jgi:uncharacterized protein YbjT (DUF2867 family)